MADTHSLDLVKSSSQYAKISDASQTGLDLSGDLTFEFWIKPTTNPVAEQRVFLSKFDSSAGANAAYHCSYHESSGTIYLRLGISDDGTAQENLDKAYTPTTGAWTHIAVSWDASTSTATFYVNGSSIGTVTGTKTSIYNSSERFIIGALGQNNSNGVQHFDGLIDDVRVWNDIRTPTEISDNYQKELTGSESNLQGYWKLNNGYLDETSNNNDLTAVNSPTFSTDVPFNGKTNTNSLDLVASSSQYASVVNAATNLNPTGNFTVEAWFKATTLVNDEVVFTNVVTDANTYGPIYKVTLYADGHINGQTWDSGSSFLTFSSATGKITTGTWYHIAFVKAAANDWKLYLVEGGTHTSVASSTSSRTISGTGKTGLRIGANEGSVGSSTPSGYYFDGLVDEVRIWNDVRTVTELDDNYQKELVGTETGLVGYWKLNNDYLDETSNSYDLTASGSPVFSIDVPDWSSSFIPKIIMS